MVPARTSWTRCRMQGSRCLDEELGGSRNEHGRQFASERHRLSSCWQMGGCHAPAQCTLGARVGAGAQGWVAQSAAHLVVSPPAPVGTAGAGCHSHAPDSAPRNGGEGGGEGGCECHQSWTCMGRGRSQRPAFGSWTPPGDRCRELFPPASCRVSVQPSWQARPASSLGPCMPVAGPEESTGASTHTVSQSPGATHRALEVGSGRGTGSAARRPPSHAPDTAPTEGAEL